MGKGFYVGISYHYYTNYQVLIETVIDYIFVCQISSVV